jgi:hypothetical protein
MAQSRAMYWGLLLVLPGNEDVAGVHVGMEKAVHKHLGKENIDTGFRQFFEIDARGLKCGHIADRDAMDTFHDQNIAATVIPVNERYIEVRRILEVAARAAMCIGGLMPAG